MNPEAFSGRSRISKMELFAEKVNRFQPLIIFVKSFILDVRLDSEHNFKVFCGVLDKAFFDSSSKNTLKLKEF